MGSLTPGQMYVIAVLGNSTVAQWVAAGVPAGVTPAVGVAFLAADIGAGTGVVISPANYPIMTIKVVGDPNLSIANSKDPHFLIQTIGATSVSDTTLIPKEPTNGSVLGLGIMLRNSSFLGKGE